MVVQIDGKTWGEARIARDTGNLAKVGEARVFEGEAWRTIYTAVRNDAITATNPAFYYPMQGNLRDAMEGTTLTLPNTARQLPDSIDFGYVGSQSLSLIPPQTPSYFTVFAWVRPDDNLGGPLFDWVSSTEDVGWYLGGDATELGFASRSATTQTWSWQPWSAILPAAQWTPIMVTMDSTQFAGSRLAGRLWTGASGAARGEVYNSSRNPFPLPTASRLHIGSFEAPSGGAEKFQGALSHVAFWDRALTAQERAAVFAMPRT